MKKLISLVLVALFVFSLSVSAMAVEVDELGYPSIEGLDGYFYPKHIIFQGALDDSVGLIFTDGHFYYQNSRAYIEDGTGLYTFYILNNGSWQLVAKDADGGMHSDSFVRILYANFTVFDKAGNSQAYPGVCNGSSCPAHDANFDGICDDCGMRLMNLVRTPTAPAVIGNNKQFVMFYTGETYYYTAYTSDTPYSIRGYVYGARMRTTTDISVDILRYSSNDGLNWALDTSTSAKDHYPGEQGWTLLSSSFNWYDSSENTSDPFFPVPLWAEVEKVTQGEMPGMTANLTEVLTILTVLGVGCLALLILLNLFGRRSLIYRG